MGRAYEEVQLTVLAVDDLNQLVRCWHDALEQLGDLAVLLLVGLIDYW